MTKGVNSTIGRWFFSLLIAALLFSFVWGGALNHANAEGKSLSFTLEVPGWTLEEGPDGYDQITITDFEQAGLTGDPLLPQKQYQFALPPNIDAESIQLDVQVVESQMLGSGYQIAPAPPVAAWDEDELIVSWGENADFIENGQSTLVYEQDAAFPAFYASLGNYAQMRKWKFINVVFTPVRYNPVSGELEIATKVDVKIFYETTVVAQTLPVTDTVMDDAAQSLFDNYDSAKDWYTDGVSSQDVTGEYGYVIITTNAIESASSQLTNFVAHKEGLGYDVYVITEDEYGILSGQAPNGRAEKIRKWLQNNYVALDIKYVLLIGNPDPDDPSNGSDSVGDLPMKMMWPRYHASYPESPSDYFYADLTGNWDLDGDEYFGEFDGDNGVGGVDFAPEVYVGRIPVYDVADGSLDSILQKTISYETSESVDWRKSALLPMSYSDAETDGAYLAEDMKSDYLNAAGFSSYTMYQQGSQCAAANSSFSSDAELFGSTAVSNQWAANDYGLVTWWAHGSSTGASYGYDECGWGTLFDRYKTVYLDDNHPSFVYQNSCLNGYPEVTTNLGYSILKQGGIATVSASRVSWYLVGTWSPGAYGDNASIGYYWNQELVANQESAGDALFLTKSDFYLYSGWQWMNLYDFNLYGDPSVNLENPLNTPSNLRVTATTDSSTTLAWDDVSGEIGYRLYRYDSDSGEYVKIATRSANATTYTDGDLYCGTEYLYKVSAYNASGETGLSETVADSTDACPAVPNDEFGAAIELNIGDSITDDTRGASSHVDDPVVNDCGLDAGKGTVWYWYYDADDTTISLSTAGASYDTFIAVWTGTYGDLDPVVCNDDINVSTPQSALAFQASGGTTYFIEVGMKSE